MLLLECTINLFRYLASKGSNGSLKSAAHRFLDLCHIRFILELFAIASIVCFFACEIDTKVSVDGKNPPSFGFKGTGYLTFFTVKEIAPENQNVPESEKNRTIWSIWPYQALQTPVGKMEPIAYGKIPPGFYQKIPQDGQPPELMEGKIYEAGGPAASAHGGYVRFTVRDGKTVELEIPTRR